MAEPVDKLTRLPTELTAQGVDLEMRSSDAPPITFPGCSEPTLGVELEVSLVDRGSRHLVARAPEVLGAMADAQHVKPELFQTIVELNTGINATVRQVQQDLGRRLEDLQAVCASLGIGCMCTGTHPMADWRHIPLTEDARYQSLVKRLAWPAQRLLICGLHVHVGVKSGEHAVALMNVLTLFLPHLLALSASSPYWQGNDTGMASCRSNVFEGLPVAGLPPTLSHWGEFVSLMRTLLRAGSIQSIREVWWDLRPHPQFGTLEVRMCDGVNTLTEICALTALIQCMVVYFQDRYDAGEPLPVTRRWILHENKWRAARFGLDAQFIFNEKGDQVSLKDHLRVWLERFKPIAVKLDCVEALAGIEAIVRHGPSYVRQRRLWDHHQNLQDVVGGLIDELAQNAAWLGVGKDGRKG